MADAPEERDRSVLPTKELLVALAKLDYLEREVWVDRHIVGRTLQAIADEFKTRPDHEAPPSASGERHKWPTTRERIRQLEQNATRKLQLALRQDHDFHARLNDPELSEKVGYRGRP